MEMKKYVNNIVIDSKNSKYRFLDFNVQRLFDNLYILGLGKKVEKEKYARILKYLSDNKQHFINQYNETKRRLTKEDIDDLVIKHGFGGKVLPPGLQNLIKVAKKKVVRPPKEITLDELYDKLRSTRRLIENKQLIIQDPPIKISPILSISELAQNQYLSLFHEKIIEHIKLARDELYANNDVLTAQVKIEYMINSSELKNQAHKFGADITYKTRTRYGPPVPLNVNSSDSEIKEVLPTFGHTYGDETHIWIGYQISYNTKNSKTSDATIKRLKAFYPVADRLYHEATEASTTDSGLCIYETFLHVNDYVKIKNIGNRMKMVDGVKQLPKDYFMNLLINEGKEIKDAVINGELVNSLMLLSKKYKTTNALFYYERNKYQKEGSSLLFKEGEYSIIDKADYWKYNGKNIMLYYKHCHVSPARYNIEKDEDDSNENLSKRKSFVLRPETLKNVDNVITKILGFDTETENQNSECKCGVFEASLWGAKTVALDEDGKSFYGEDALKNFIDFINSISTRVNVKKSHANKKIEKIHMYGFNNTNFDNLLIYDALYKHEPTTEFIFTSSSIKHISYRNIEIYDMSSYYAGTLEQVAESFDLPIHKGVFPYKFPNKDNLYYKGKIPDKEYWPSEKNYKICLQEFGKENLKEHFKTSELQQEFLGIANKICRKENKKRQEINNKEEYTFQMYLQEINEDMKKEFFKSNEDYCSCLKVSSNLDLEESGIKNEFNLKEYCEKYCLLDSKLVYEIAKIHLQNSIGGIKRMVKHIIKRRNPNDEDEYITEEKDILTNKLFNLQTSLTAAGCSLKVFKQVFLDENIYQSPDSVVKDERVAYIGGRTEAFKKNFYAKDDKYLYYYDINSSYPASMTLDMPYKYIKTMLSVVKNISIDDISSTNLYLSTGEYMGNHPDFITNILTRVKEGDIMPTKKWNKQWLWGCELIEAIKAGCEVSIEKMHVYEPKAIFKEFAEYFYNERLKVKTTNPALAAFFKTLMNSLYGKFGQRVFTKKQIVEDSNEMFDVLNQDNKLVSFNYCGDKIIMEYETKDEEYTSIGKLVRFSSYIAAQSRCKLSEMMRDVGYENVYYCDTDSLFTSKIPSAHLVHQTELGKWKMETKYPIEAAIFLAAKTYWYKQCETGKECAKSKGVDSTGLNESDYELMLNGGSVEVERDSTFFRSFDGVRIMPTSRTIKSVYNKRIWDGMTSQSFGNISEWRDCKAIIKQFEDEFGLSTTKEVLDKAIEIREKHVKQINEEFLKISEIKPLLSILTERAKICLKY